MSTKFMIKLQGTVYSNELYSCPSINGEHIFDFEEAIERAEQLFPDCNWTVYNGEDCYSNYEED